MAKLNFKAGTTSKSVLIFVQDSSATTGVGLSGLVFNTSSLVAYYCQPGVTGSTAITLATLASTTAAYSSGGFKEIDATNMKGVYRFDIPNAALTGATSVVIMLSGAANMAPVVLEIQLDAVDNQDAVHFGLSGIPNNAAGASGGLLISGSNSGTTTLGALTVSGATTLTGNVSMAAGCNITQSSSNTSAVVITGNGTGHGIAVTSGSGATGDGIRATAASTNGNGINSLGAGTGDGFMGLGGATGRGMHLVGGSSSGAGFRCEGTAGNANALELAGQGSAAGLSTTGGGTGAGVAIVGGGTSGAGLTVTTTSGDGLSITPTAGNGITVTANGASKHGAVITGGTSGTSDGIKAVAGTGGVPIRGDITGSLSGSVGSVAGSVGGNVSGSVNSVATGLPTNFSALSIDASGNVKIQGQVKKNTALAAFPFKMVLTSDHLTGATGKTVSCQRGIDGAALANCNTVTATETANGWYKLDLAASDLNGNTILFRATAASCDPTEITIVTQP